MKILISPTVREPYKNQLEYAFDKKWIDFLLSAFHNIDIFLPNQKYDKLDLIILSGGNDLIKFSKNKNDLIRYNQDKEIIGYAIKNKIPIIGICYGAQLISHILGCKLKALKNHIGNHPVKTSNNFLFPNKKNTIVVNSFHNVGIVEASKKIKTLAIANDGSVELFMGNDIKCLGIMWHPERYNRFRKVDLELFLNFCGYS